LTFKVTVCDICLRERPPGKASVVFFPFLLSKVTNVEELVDLKLAQMSVEKGETNVPGQSKSQLARDRVHPVLRSSG